MILYGMGRTALLQKAQCCSNQNLPWFKKMLNETTTEDIEVRLCQDEVGDYDGTPLELIELYVR